MSTQGHKRQIGYTISFDDAPCMGLTRLFFSTTNMVEDAKVICDTCNYKRECLEFALSTKQSDGVWGGINFSNTREFSAFKRNLRRYANK